MTTEQKIKKNRILTGVIVSDKMDKTVVVRIEGLRKHSKYKKYYQVSQNFKVHDAENQYHTGDKVEIQETRPISKDKRWVVVQKLT